MEKICPILSIGREHKDPDGVTVPYYVMCKEKTCEWWHVGDGVGACAIKNMTAFLGTISWRVT